MKKFILIASFLFFSVAYAEITCESKADYSCDQKGMCFDFFENSMGDAEVWESLCDVNDGVFKQGSCDRSKAVVSCLSYSNPIMPIIHFKADFSVEDATQACTMQSGVVCK